MHILSFTATRLFNYYWDKPLWNSVDSINALTWKGFIEVHKAGKLTPAQRLAYSATLFAWFDSLRSLLFVVLPIAIIFTGAIPVDTSLIVFGPIFLGTFLMQLAALRLLARGHSPPVLSLTFDLLRMPAVIPALGELITGRGRKRQGHTGQPKLGCEFKEIPSIHHIP